MTRSSARLGSTSPTAPAKALCRPAQRLSEAVGIGLDEILAAVQKLGPWEAGATLVGEGRSPSAPPQQVSQWRRPREQLSCPRTRGAAAQSLGVVRPGDVDGLSDQASRGDLAARLSANQRILLAVILIVAVCPVLPPEAQMTRGWLQL